MGTWKALARARAPSFSRRFLPAMNTLSLSGAPMAVDRLWQAIRASARICTHRRQPSSPRPFGLVGRSLPAPRARPLTFPPPTPMPQLLSFSSLRLWQQGLFSSRSIPLTPSGPKALSLRSSSVSRTPAHISASPRQL